jgi:periplasmic protein TonB
MSHNKSHYSLPVYGGAHVAAAAGVVLLHGGLLAWQMAPLPPIAIAQQQVIQISMVAPSTPPVEVSPVVPEIVSEPVSPVPPKAEGMQKIQPEPRPAPVAPQPTPTEPAAEQQPTPSPPQQTSGLQSPDATLQQAAITEPLNANYLKNPPPVYPRAALRRQQQGTVLIEVRVSISGQPLAVAIDRSSGYGMLDAAALDAVRKWQFIPARRGSEVVEASVVVPVEFRIN